MDCCLSTWTSSEGPAPSLKPQFDDEFAYPVCNTDNLWVVSISYSKSPFHRCPTQTQDNAVIVQEVLADSSSPIDRSNVVIRGSSSGENLGFEDACLGMYTAGAAEAGWGRY